MGLEFWVLRVEGLDGIQVFVPYTGMVQRV